MQQRGKAIKQWKERIRDLERDGKGIMKFTGVSEEKRGDWGRGR